MRGVDVKIRITLVKESNEVIDSILERGRSAARDETRRDGTSRDIEK